MMKYLFFVCLCVLCVVADAVAGNGDGVAVVECDSVRVRLMAMSPTVIRVSVVPKGRGFSERGSLVVVADDVMTDCVVVERGDDVVRMRTDSLVACVDVATGGVSFADGKGRLLLSEDVSGRVMDGYVVDGDSGLSVGCAFNVGGVDDGFYGLGQHQADEFNYRGRNEQLFQYNTKVSVPMVVSSGGYGVLWDGYSLCRWGSREDYRRLGDVFGLFDVDGVEGGLTGRYVGRGGDVLVRREGEIGFEFLERGDLGHVRGLPRDFDLKGSSVVYEGWIVAPETGRYEFLLYYSGYQRLLIDGEEVIGTRWRTAWNPNGYKVGVDLEGGRMTRVRLEWVPDGSVAYCGLRALGPVDGAVAGQMRWWGEMQDMVDYYFIGGGSMDGVLGGYRRLTGGTPMMPKWAMGFWQSREKYNTADEVVGTVAEYRRRGIGLDNIVIDWLHWPEDSWGSHVFDSRRFPDPKGMVDSVHAMDGRVMVSVWPKFYESTEHFREFDSRGWMYRGAINDSIRDWVGPGYLGSFYDAFNPDARRLFWSQISDHYVPLGIDAWWMDASEPNIRDCVDIDYRKALMSPTFLGSADRVFNAYGLVNAEAIYCGQRGSDADRRVFLLTRSGFAGQQRYSTATWSGDIAARWEDMRAQLSAGLNFAMSGIPFWTMDIGGFCVEERYVKAQKLFDRTGEENADLREWREMNARWFQFGGFVPLFRAHGQFPRREVYNIAPEGHPVYDAIKGAIGLRYNLMPYIYSLVGMVTHDDYTIMRPMVMDFTGDAAVRSMKDQYMFGPSLLVAPVCVYGARQRSVYLPDEGMPWYDFYTGRAVPGGGTVCADAPLERIPLFVRSGSIIPVCGDIVTTKEASGSPLTVLVYGGRDGEFTLYDDDGVSYGYERGEFMRIVMRYDDAAGTLTISAPEGGFAGQVVPERINVVKIDAEHPVADALRARGVEVSYGGRAVCVNLNGVK